MHMQPYIIQYPSTYPNCDSSQRPVIANNNLVKTELVDSKAGEKSEAKFKIFTVELGSLRLISYSKKKVATIAQARIIGESI